MGQIANQMALELFFRLKERITPGAREKSRRLPCSDPSSVMVALTLSVCTSTPPGNRPASKSCVRLDIDISSIVFSCSDCIEPRAGRQWDEENQMLFGAKTLEWSW